MGWHGSGWRRSGRVVPAIGLTAVLGISACSSGTAQRTESGYCDTVRTNLTELNAPGISVPGDVGRTVTLYETMAKAAPLAVEKEWDVLALAYQTAATVVPADPTSMQKAADTIRGAQQSAHAVADYTLRLCQVQIGNASVPTTLLSGSTTIDPNAPAATLAETGLTPSTIDPTATTALPPDGVAPSPQTTAAPG